MTSHRFILPLLALLCIAPSLTASGPVGIYGIIEKVVFEPNESAPERVQVWGAFAYVDGGPGGTAISAVKRGYLYFQGSKNPTPAVELREWSDLKSVAGTGQAVGFGRWAYSGQFGSLEPGASSNDPPHIFASTGTQPAMTDMRVRSESEAANRPATYQTNTGVMKLSKQGSHAEVVRQLEAALKK
jgi:hypothetical protein